ncbi:hypothetical protein [Bacillus sp. SG-1]|uniref:hypothetical protein n=1 Tax=Bacillus sp. SG-1 TaxID=161544 RepID=UPI0002EC87BA|nr:hypothetical protein [Bacillus sp. SG-1]
MNKAVEKRKKWTVEEEKIVTDTVLKFLRDGKAQKEAFDEAAQTIGRTSAACSFRWNNKLKKETVMETDHTPASPSPISLEDCISFLQGIGSEQDAIHENKKLKEQQRKLQKKLLAAEKTYNKLKTDYKELLTQIDLKELNAVPSFTI